MKILSLLRHAEAEQGANVKDFDRQLSSFGNQITPRFGRRLEQEEFMPDRVCSSEAVRAHETAKIICYEIGFPVEKLDIRPELYRAQLDQLLALVRGADENDEHLLIVAHNPVISELVHLLCPDQSGLFIATCGLVTIHLPLEYWALIEPGCGLFQRYETPQQSVAANH